MGKNKVCFVIMGFGKKMDYRNSREVDLDLIYEKAIKPLFQTKLNDYKLIRADEISGSDIIDVKMYKLLMNADLVIADITTMNENALYELGVRHALRPFSTIIMLQKSEKGCIPFDLSHNRLLTYEDFGEKLDDEEAQQIEDLLYDFIDSTTSNEIDSPFYTYLQNVKPPFYSTEEDTNAINDFVEQEKTLSYHLDLAHKFNNNSDFVSSVKEWGILHKLSPANNYITQQYALSRYKSKSPNATIALQEALDIIKTLEPDSSLDLETLGITGAIYKRLFSINQNYDYLDEAIKMYRKGYIIKNDYYNGENYANCVLLMTQKNNILNNEQKYLRYKSRKIYTDIANDLERKVQIGEINIWMYATLSICYYVLNDNLNHEKYKKLFIDNTNKEWEHDTFYETLDKISSCL